MLDVTMTFALRYGYGTLAPVRLASYMAAPV